MSVFSKLKGLFSSGGGSGARVNVSKRFELIGRAGQGSMSKTFRARDRELGRIVCLKILDKEKTSKFEARFPGLNRPTEGEICMALKHKNIVTTYDYGRTTDNEPFLVMELVDGKGLNFLIETGSDSLNGKRIDILVQMAEGFEYIHKHGFLHRDICPRNIMVAREGVVKIIDFGLTIPNRPEFLRPGNRTGTTNYLAPELIKRAPTDHRVDMFALGLTAYETITGQLPWEKAESMQLLLSHMNSPGKDPCVFRSDLDPAIIKLLIKSVERAPHARFQNPTEFRLALLALPEKHY